MSDFVNDNGENDNRSNDNMDGSAHKMVPVHTAVAHPWLCDIMGHMTTRHYTAIFDDASYLFFYRVFGWSGSDARNENVGWADVRHEVDYADEVPAGDLLEVRASFQRIGGKSVTISYEMYNLSKSSVAATLTSTCVLFDTDARKAVTIGDEMRALAEPFLPDV